jgi:autotransporter-associated beta strand protein
LNGGASYLWNLQGSVNDLIASSGGITFNGTSSNLMTISILTNATTSWNSETSTNFTIMTAGSGFTGFNAAAFAFSGTNSMTDGTWSIQTSGNNLNLLYTFISPTNVWTNGSGNLSTIKITNNSNLTFDNPNYTALVTNNAQVTALSGITFNAGAGTNTLSGSNVSIGTAGIVNNSAATQTVALGLTQSAASSVTAASGNLVISGSLDTAGYNLTLNGSSNTTVSGNISGNGAITKSGTGTTTLTASNTYTGGTTISAGTLSIGVGGSILGNVTNAASLVFDPTGSLVLLFSGNITNTSSNSIISVVSGTLQAGNGSVSNTIFGDAGIDGANGATGTNALTPGGAGGAGGNGGSGENGGTAMTLTNGANLFNSIASLIAGGDGGRGGGGGAGGLGGGGGRTGPGGEGGNGNIIIISFAIS